MRKRSGSRPRGVSPSTSAEVISKFPSSLRENDWLHSHTVSERGSSRCRPPTPGKLTVPKTPQLQSRQRSRPVKVLGFAEQEKRELEEMKNHKFKAKPINKDIFRMGGLYGLKQSSSSEQATIPQSPQLATKLRGGRKRSLNVAEEEEEEREPFKANPVPRAMFERVSGVPERQCISLTTTHTPALLRKKRRVEVEEDKEEEEEKVSVLKALPLPDFAKVFKPQLPHKKTNTQPFSFEGCYRTKDEVVEELVAQDEETAAEKREFTASTMPDHNLPPALPPKLLVLKTQLEPFQLKTEERGEHRNRTFSAKVNEELLQLKKMAEFKASDAKTIYSKPFVPSRSTKPLTESNSLVGHTEHRLEQRAKYDDHIKKMNEIKEQVKINRQAMKDSEEVKEVKKLRRSLVHKAQPVQQYPSIKVHPSMKKTTAPLSPVLTSGSRLRSSHSARHL